MAPTFKKIQTIEVGAGGSASIDFTGIPSTWTDLVVKISGRTNYASDVVDTVAIKLNSNTSSYSWREIYGNGGTAGSASGSTQRTTFTNGDSATANTFGNSEIYIPNYAGSTYKSISADGVAETNAATSWMALDAQLWSNTAAINAISIIPILGTLWKQFSSATLYGIKNS